MLQNGQRLPNLNVNQPNSDNRAVHTGGLNKYVVGLLLFGAVVGYEKAAPPNVKLSAIFGSFEGNTEAESLRTKLDATQQMLAMQNAENAKMQNEVNKYKAALENAVNYYKTELALQQQALGKRQEAVIESQKANLDLANFADIVSLFANMGGEKDIAEKAAMVGSVLRQKAYGEIDRQAPTWGGIGTQPTPAAASRATQRLPLARVGTKSPKLLVRSAPQKDGSTVLCVLPTGAVVQLLGQSERDATHNITFVQASFNRRGYGNMTGWISQWSLEDVPASSSDGATPQTCDDPKP